MALPVRPKRAVARYDIAGVPALPGGVGTPPRNRNARTRLCAIPDAMPDAKGRHNPVLGNVVTNTDIVEWELSHGRISDGAYSMGRLIEGIFNKARGPGGGGQWRQGDRVDAWVAHELAIIWAIDNARSIKRWTLAVERELGRIDAKILRQVLGEGKSFAEVAALNGRAGERGTNYYAQRWRDALETLADRWAARGKGA